MPWVTHPSVAMGSMRSLMRPTAEDCPTRLRARLWVVASNAVRDTRRTQLTKSRAPRSPKSRSPSYLTELADRWIRNDACCVIQKSGSRRRAMAGAFNSTMQECDAHGYKRAPAVVFEARFWAASGSCSNGDPCDGLQPWLQPIWFVWPAGGQRAAHQLFRQLWLLMERRELHLYPSVQLLGGRLRFAVQFKGHLRSRSHALRQVSRPENCRTDSLDSRLRRVWACVPNKKLLSFAPLFRRMPHRPSVDRNGGVPFFTM